MDMGDSLTHSGNGNSEKTFNLTLVDKLQAMVAAEWPQNQLLNIYLFGSRLYGVHKQNSDYDFIGICGGEYFYAYRLIDSTIPAEMSPTGEALDININMMHLTYFKESLKDAYINSVMLCFIPPSFVFLELVDIRSEFLLHLPNIRQSVQMDSTHNFAKAKRLWRLGDFYTAKKNIVHGIRYLNYSLQLLGPKGSIYDFTAGNEYWSEVMALPEPGSGDTNGKENSSLWRAIDARFAPIYKDLTEKMKLYCDCEVEKAQQWEWRWIERHFAETSPADAKSYFRHCVIPPQILIDYIHEFGLDAVSRNFGVTYTRHKAHPNLISLGRTQMASLELSLVQWCSGIVLDDAIPNQLSVVALPFPKIFASTSDTEMQPIIDWSVGDVVVETLLDGRLARVYHYAGQWHVGSKESPDGTEQIGWVSPIRLANWKDYVVDGFNFNPVHEANMLLSLYDDGRPNPTFAQHFWEIFAECHFNIEKLDPSHTYLFEVQSPWMMNIVEQKERYITLLGARIKGSLQELDITDVSKEMGCDPKFLTTKWILDGDDDASLPVIPLASGLTHTAKLIQNNGEIASSSSDPKATSSRRKKKVYNEETGSANLPPPTLSDSIYSRLRFFDPTVYSGLLVRTSDGRRLAFRSPQFLSLDRLHPLSDAGQVQKLLLELSRNLYPRTWMSLPKYECWLEKFAAVDDNYLRIVQYVQEKWDEARALVKSEGRAAGAAYLAKHPTVSAELYLLIKWQALDTTIKDHFSKIPLKRLQQQLKKVADLLEAEKAIHE
jgi:hypothetical protein